MIWLAWCSLKTKQAETTSYVQIEIYNNINIKIYVNVLKQG